MEQAKDIDATVGTGWAFMEWEQLSGERSTLPAALVLDAAGRLGAVANIAGRVKARWLEDKAQAWTGDWVDLGAPIAGTPAAARAGDGRIAVFYRDPESRLMCLRQNTDRTGWEAPAWMSQALLQGDPIVGLNGDGRIEVFLIGTDGALYHVWTSAAGAEQWSGAEQFGGGAVRDIAVTTTVDGRQAFFHVNTAGELWLIQQSAANGYWSDFTNPANGVTGLLSAGPSAHGPLLTIFASHQSGSDNVLSYAQQQPDTSWNGPDELPFDETARPNTTPSVRPALLRGPSGRLIAVHAHGTALWVIHQPEDPTANFGAWTTIWHGGQYYIDKGINALLDTQGRLVVLAVSTKFGLWCFRYTPA